MTNDKEDKIPQVIIPPEIKAQMEKDPALAEALRDMSAQMRQAMQGVEDGRYANFNDAMEALTGQRPKLVVPRYVPKHGLYLSTGPHPRQPDTLIAVCSDGTPKLHGEDFTILSVETVQTQEEARAWFNHVSITEPWMGDDEDDEDEDAGESGNDPKDNSTN